MKIERIKIDNFRSIEAAEFNSSNFNIFVGQNNCGKTNLFEAVEFFFNGISSKINIEDLKYLREANRVITVEIQFSGALRGAEQMQHAANKTKIEQALNGSDTVTFLRSSADSKKRKMSVNGQEVRQTTGFDAALNDFLPKFEYITTKQYYESVAKYGKTTPIGIMLSGVLTAILEGNTQYQEFQNTFLELFNDDGSPIKAQFVAVGTSVKTHLQKQFPDCTKVKFEVSLPVFEDLLKNFDTTIDDGVETFAEEKGDGMQRALMLAIIQSYAEFRRERDDIGKSFLFFIDEAELHLHPTAQRNLKSVLLTLSQGDDQVFINTHSSVFVADNETGQSIFKVEKVEKRTLIELVTDREKPYVVFELLGGSPSDLLLPRNFLLVEGQSEFELFTRVISRFYTDKPPIQIVKANGDIDQAERTINAIEKLFIPLSTSIYKNKCVILIDRPHADREGGVTQFLDNNRHLRTNNQFFRLPERDIEQCYPNNPDPTYTNWKKTQAELDAVDQDGKKTFTSHKKKQLAKHVGANITQAQFETDLIVCFQALSKCWELAF